MIIKQKNTYFPIIITFETREEATALRDIADGVHTEGARDLRIKISNAFTDTTMADGNEREEENTL